MCRSYANGAVSATTYTVRLSRLDKKMITMLAAEGIAGTLPGSGTTVLGIASGSTTDNANEEKIKDAREQVAKDRADLEKASKAMSRNLLNG